jgi:hypothetical protein
MDSPALIDNSAPSVDEPAVMATRPASTALAVTILTMPDTLAAAASERTSRAPDDAEPFVLTSIEPPAVPTPPLTATAPPTSNEDPAAATRFPDCEEDSPVLIATEFAPTASPVRIEMVPESFAADSPLTRETEPDASPPDVESETRPLVREPSLLLIFMADPDRTPTAAARPTPSPDVIPMEPAAAPFDEATLTAPDRVALDSDPSATLPEKSSACDDFTIALPLVLGLADASS